MAPVRTMLPTPPTTPYPAYAAKYPGRTCIPTASAPHARGPALPLFGATTPQARAKRRGDHGTSHRQLSDNELSYYLPSRADGVNDMYVHHGLRAHPAQLSHARVRLAWAVQLARHPLLASTISMRAYDDVAFVHSHPASVDDALAAADARMQYFTAGALDLVDAYLNGPRTLGNDMLACLVVRRGTRRVAGQSGACGPNTAGAEADAAHAHAAQSSRPGPNHCDPVIGTSGVPPATATSPAGAAGATAATAEAAANPNLVSGVAVALEPPLESDLETFEVMLCTTHYVGDGMALHTFMNELYTLLGSKSDGELLALLEAEVGTATQLPPSLETRLGLSTLQTAVGDVAQRKADAALLGGQVLPIRKGQPRHTIVPTHAFTPEETAVALAKCKAHGVTIAHVVFGLCAVAWNKDCADRSPPTMIYSALNMRPHAAPEGSFFHLAVGYFNVVLPSLAPLPPADLVWHRAAQTKAQTHAAVKSPLSRAMFRATAAARAARSQHWAAIEHAAVDSNPGLGLGITLPQREAPAPDMPAAKRREPPPPPAGRALMGVSMLGNLDGMYRRADHGGIELFGLTTGSRQRPGGLLLFAYTLAGKLWLSLGYDENGFESGAIERFWADVLDLARAVLLS